MKRPDLRTPDPEKTELDQALRYVQNALVFAVYSLVVVALTVLSGLLIWHGSIWVWHHLGYTLMSVLTIATLTFLMWGE